MKELPHSLSPTANFLARHSSVMILAVFAVAGAAVLDDYGAVYDELYQRRNGYASFNYMLGDEKALLPDNLHDRFFGVAFEIPLIVVERLLGLEDSRDIYLSRRALTHMFFLAGGFFASLLAYRLFGSRLIAPLVMPLFLLHPRLYAHSFFNPKDLPFLSMFMIALYLTHRAFRRDTVWAFALCGAGAGLLANIRIMGFMLFPAVLGMLALDAFYAMKRGNGASKRVLINLCAFLTAFAATLYAVWPMLWRDPLSAIDAFETLARHPHYIPSLFRGEIIRWPNIPWDFIPTWVLITTPPAALLLAALGIGRLARLCAARRRDALAGLTARFGLLAAACLVLPVAAAVALNANMHDDWRHMYFLYAPLCVLAAFGLRALADIPRPNLRAAALALAALGISLAAVQTVRLHPYQSDYFNSLADKSGLGDRWSMDYWNSSSVREALETVLEMQPTGRVAIAGGAALYRNLAIIPKDDRGRLYVNPHFPSFRISYRAKRNAPDGDAAIWTGGVYGVPLAAILDARANSEAARQAAYAAARASQAAASAGGFDIYAAGGDGGGRLVYIKEDCGDEYAPGRFALSIFPVEQSDLPKRERDAGLEYEPIHFDFFNRGAIFDGGCILIEDLPEYPISHIETWQYTPGESPMWSARILFDGYYERHRRALASLSAEPAIRSDFDVHIEDDRLIYAKESCAEGDARGRFFLSVFPADPRDLPQAARDAGLEHEPLNFDFERGAIFDGKCAIIRDLPGYTISRIETGQWTEEEGELWSGEILFEAYYERYWRASASPAREPAARSDFDIYLKDGALIYVKSPCAEEDARGRFFLSVFPADPRDLPQTARDAGSEHEPLNFDFDRRGSIFDGKCVIIRDLPDYPINRIETGQWLPGEGELWSAGVKIGD